MCIHSCHPVPQDHIHYYHLNVGLYDANGHQPQIMEPETEKQDVILYQASLSTPPLTPPLPPATPSLPIDIEPIRNVLLSFLSTMNVQFPPILVDPAPIIEASRAEAMKMNLPTAGVNSPTFQAAMRAAAPMALETYGHLDAECRSWACLYTTCTIYLDDMARIPTQLDMLRSFNSLFITNCAQLDPVLDVFAGLLRMADVYFGPTSAALIVANNLDFVASLVLEQDQQDMQLHEDATSYPTYFRSLTGVARAFACLAFPQHIPHRDYIQVLPDLMRFIDDVNDVLSFYKEELVQEDDNHISLIAKVRGCTKLEALRDLAAASAERSERILRILRSTNMQAHDMIAYGFFPGYINFHALSSKRYKLCDLRLETR
ncbi:Trichodiene synthase-domain-containing protein [Infundibulicybe gibba]|nr:Trichodiene synthase-domain-containing protein [Infundibulicybe gibba]